MQSCTTLRYNRATLLSIREKLAGCGHDPMHPLSGPYDCSCGSFSLDTPSGVRLVVGNAPSTRINISERALSIWSLNVRSLVKHHQSLRDMIEKDSPDLIFITETWLQDADTAIINLAFPPNYTVFTLNRTSRGVGIAMAIKSCFPAEWKALDLPACESASFKVAFSHQFTLSGMLIYRPPGNDTVFKAALVVVVSSLASKCANFNIVGDLNIHLDLRSLAPINTFLADLEAMQLNQLVTSPTHTGGHILDPFFTTLERATASDPMVVGWTDHLLVKVSCFIADPQFKPVDRLILKRNWHKLKLEEFFKILEAQPLGILLNVEQGYEQFCNWILAALDSLIPMRWSKCHAKVPSPWYNDTLADLKRACRQAERAWRKSFDSTLKSLYFAQLKIYHRTICQTRAAYYAFEFQNNPNPSKLIFKVLKDLMGKRATSVEICTDSHCESLASFFVEKVQAIYRGFTSSVPDTEQTGVTATVHDTLSSLP
ncbi:uncharacterized protein LOC144766843 [Lissotriton helveticus]